MTRINWSKQSGLRLGALALLVIGTVAVSGCGANKAINSAGESMDDGVLIAYDQEGGEIHTTYEQGIENGAYAWYRPDGTVYIKGQYAEGQKVNTWTYDDAAVRIESYYVEGDKWGEEQRWSRVGAEWLLWESRFYIEGRQIASGTWKCQTEGGECQAWQGMWLVREGAAEGEKLFVRRFDEGRLMGERVVAETDALYGIMAHL